MRLVASTAAILALVAGCDREGAGPPTATVSRASGEISHSTLGVSTNGPGSVRELTYGTYLAELQEHRVRASSADASVEAAWTAGASVWVSWNAEEKQFEFRAQARADGANRDALYGWWLNNRFKYQVAQRVTVHRNDQLFATTPDETSPWSPLTNTEYMSEHTFTPVYIGNNGGQRACFGAVSAMTGRAQHWSRITDAQEWVAGELKSVTVIGQKDGCVNLEASCDGGQNDELRTSAPVAARPRDRGAFGAEAVSLEGEVVYPGVECGTGGAPDIPYYYRCFTTITYWAETGMILDVSRRCFIVYTD